MQTPKIFRLWPGRTQEGNPNKYDVELIRFAGWGDCYFINPEVNERDRGAPNPIEYQADLQWLAETDCPYKSTHGELISRRTLALFQALGDFAVDIFPARIHPKPTKSKKPPVAPNEEFLILKLMTWTDCLDLERTLVDGLPFSETNQQWINPENVEHWGFKEPPEGFPPVFMPNRCLFYCFPETTVTACKKAGLKGMHFMPIHWPRFPAEGPTP